MTEQEGATFAERLTRIWTGKRPLRQEMEWSNFRYYNAWDVIGSQFQFFAHIREGVHFMYIGPDSSNLSQQPLLRLMHIKGGEAVSNLEYRVTSTPAFCSDNTPHIEPETRTLWADKWLPLFRRGCWLSGCDIVASAHEKAEWMQGFTREEIQAWNLKI